MTEPGMPHASTPIGTTDNSLGTGIHLSELAPVAATGLANHYEPVDAYHRSVNLLGPLPAQFFPIISRDCPHCGPALGLPAAECIVCSLEELPALPLRVSRVLAVLPGGDAGVLTTVGSLAPLRAPISESLGASFAQGLEWVNQAEPSAHLGKSWSAPLAVGIEPATGSVAEAAYFANGRLLSQADVQGTIIGPGPSLQSTSAKASPVKPSSSSGPSSEFTTVYSRSTGRLFQLGGPVSDLLGHLRIAYLEEPGWQSIGLDASLGSIRAATYSHRDRLLWLLDEIPAHWKPFVRRRLLTIDPESGHVDVLLERLSFRHLFEHHLVTDRDGSVLLALSGKLWPKHLLVRFSKDGDELSIETSTLRKHRLAMAPVVDDAGYWLVTRRKGKKKPPRVKRLETLPLKPIHRHKCAPHGM